MPVLSNMLRRLTLFVGSSKPSAQVDSADSPQSLAPVKIRHSTTAAKIEHQPVALTVNKKRKAEHSPEDTSSKRYRRSRNSYTPSLDDESDDENDTEVIKDTASADRLRMPPPATPRHGKSVHQAIQKSMNMGGEYLDIDAESEVSFETSATSKRRADPPDEFDMELARRHAAAVQLPANSGVWARGEQELFYHLALRGFEPLLPHNWMLDFKTLPLSLYARENTDNAPLIFNMRGTEFRAIRALRDLIETGKLVRDKSLSSPGFQAESMLEKAMTKYLSWAMADAGIYNKFNELPVHSIVIRRKGQSTTETLAEITGKLHFLAAKHRQIRGIRPSIETRDLTPLSNDQTQVYDEDDDLPVLTGLMIASSVLAVFTLNAHAPHLSGQSHQQRVLDTPMSGIAPQTNGPEESGLRFIATFDFSKPTHDVWNALSAAIVVMHIRKTMLDQLTKDDFAAPMQLDSGRLQSAGDSDDPDL